MEEKGEMVRGMTGKEGGKRNKTVYMYVHAIPLTASSSYILRLIFFSRALLSTLSLSATCELHVTCTTHMVQLHCTTVQCTCIYTCICSTIHSNQTLRKTK